MRQRKTRICSTHGNGQAWVVGTTREGAHDPQGLDSKIIRTLGERVVPMFRARELFESLHKINRAAKSEHHADAEGLVSHARNQVRQVTVHQCNPLLHSKRYSCAGSLRTEI